MATRKHSRAREAQLGFEAISIEGGLLSPEWLSKVAQLAAETQGEADYRIPKGLNLRDEIGRFWRIGQAHWRDFASGLTSKAEAKALAERFVVGFLKESLGFASLAAVPPAVLAERTYPLGHVALGGRVPVVIAPAASGIDTLSPVFGDGGRRRSPFGLAQEYLNAAEGSLWGLVADGATLRILRDNASLTRPAWIEADLNRIFTEERYADFAALWLLLHESRFGREGQPVSECALETWREAGKKEGTRAREHLRRGVEDALVALGQGFLAHPENHALRAALQNGSLSTRDYFSQLLRLVYRLIFLLTVEERNLLHPEGTRDAVRSLYAHGYSLRRLCEKSVKRSAHDRFLDLWEATKVSLRGLASGEPRLGLPALAGIFAQNQCPALDAAKLENRALLLAVFKLAWLKDDGALARVNWRDMGPEELGSVYESLLELVPQISQEGRRFGFATGDETKGNARKTSGSYYTPDSLVQVLLDSALEPVIADTIARNADRPIEALLSLSIVDPACGSGHFLLAAARRLAAHVARLQANGTPSGAEYRHALRQVVGKCIYGVDLNPMAVELCKVSLWMEAVEPGLPLTFLNSHIQHGNALLGTTPGLMAKGIPDAAWEPIEGDDRKVASALRKRNKQEAGGQRGFDTLWSSPAETEAQAVTKAVNELEAASDADAAELARKEAKWEDILTSQEYRQQKFVADSWCAAFVWPKQLGPQSEVAPTNELWRQLRDGQGRTPELTRETVKKLAQQYRFFHWHLQYPQVFAKAGFDVVLGNPPWERVKLQEQEFFAERRPEIADAANATLRKRLIESLKVSAPTLFGEFQDALRQADGESHLMRDSGRYPLCGRGDVNTYALFAELGHALLAKSGMLGCITPIGLVTETTTSLFFGRLLEHGSIAAIIGFVNERQIFPAVLHNVKFCIFVASGGSRTTPKARVVFNCFGVEEAEEPEKTIFLDWEKVKLLNPATKTCPTFFTRKSFELSVGIYERLPILSLTELSGWDLSFYSMLHMSGDSELFHSTSFEGAVLLYEAKMFHQYNHRFGTFEGAADGERVHMLPEVSTSQLADANFVLKPCYYVAAKEVSERLRGKVPNNYLVALRSVTSVHLGRTCVCSVLPFAGAGHSIALVTFRGGRNDRIPQFVAEMNSFVHDFCIRQKLSGFNLSAYIAEQIPCVPVTKFSEKCDWDSDSKIAEWLSVRVLELTYTAWDLEAFAQDCGWSGPPFRWDEERRVQLRCELDAAFFHLYGLNREDTAYVMDTFPIVRKHDEKAHGEYRTKRVILELYDALAEATRTGQPYQTRLSPAPASIGLTHPPKFDRERVNVDVGNYILAFVFSLLRHYDGECDVMRLARAYALLLQRATFASLVEARFGAEAQRWVETSTQVVDGRWFLPILRQMDSRGIVILEVRGDDVVVRQKDQQGPPGNATVETDVYLVRQVLDLVPAITLAEPVKRIMPKVPRVALQEALMPV